MRLIQAECAIEYEGRCHTFLGYAVRLVMIKEDGSVLVMNDKGIKPLNYMMNVKSTNTVVSSTGAPILIVEGRKETLRIHLQNVLQDIYLPFAEDDDMAKTGTEDELQAHMLQHLGYYVPGSYPICREFETGKGRVDVCGMGGDGRLVLVELKRKAVRKDVYQVLRYADGIDQIREAAVSQGVRELEIKSSMKGQTDKTGEMVGVEALEGVHLYLGASAFTKNTKEEAAEHGVGIIDVSEARRLIEENKMRELEAKGAPVKTMRNGEDEVPIASDRLETND